jgi:hypothetical protein
MGIVLNRKKYLRLFLIFSLIVCRKIFPQQDVKVIDDNNLNTLTRNKLSVGFVKIIEGKSEPILDKSFINFSRRVTKLNSFSKPFKIELGFEGGINFIPEPLLLIPYAKTAVELNLIKYLTLSGNLGLGASLIQYQAAFLFWGFNSNYLIPLNKDLFIEFEIGFNSPIISKDSFYLVYFSTGIAIK